jgi:hypothetical protein
MGQAAVVFVNHPACASEHEARRPNYWRGNGYLPRVAQWRDTLIAIHMLPEDDWLGFTHAYFPTYAFDAHTLRDRWAFARKGNAYLALTAAQGLAWSTDRRHARHELRSYGRHNIWLCQMGRAALDGTFDEFQTAILTQRVTFDDLTIQLETMRGTTLAFGWRESLLHNGEPVALHDSRHHQSLYGYADFPAEELLITYAEQGLRLHFT